MEEVSVHPVARNYIAVHFSTAIQGKLGVFPERDNLSVSYGLGEDHYHLCLIRGFSSTIGIPLFQLPDGGCGFNLRLLFLPQAKKPPYPISLPHHWRGRYLMLDYRPLQKIS